MTTEPFPAHISDLLAIYGIDTVFGIVGIPIVEIADTIISKGKIRFYGFRNEQAASYAASAYGYLTGKPGVLLVVGGPGLIHALAGVYNSISNKWPLLVLAGSSEDLNRGGFQALDQIAVLSRYVKFSSRLNNSNVNEMLYNALRQSMVGTPGVSYLDIPGDLIEQSVEKVKYNCVRNITKVEHQPSNDALQRVADLITENSTKSLLCVIGKGATDSSMEVRKFIERFQLPFLPTPMAKGVVPDSHPLNVSSARSLALRSADIVLVLGARLNWILHFGEPPKWNQNAIFVQVDTSADELGFNNSAGTQYSLCGHIGATLQSLTPMLKKFKYCGLSRSMLQQVEQNKVRLRAKETQKTLTLNYNQVYAAMREHMVDRNTFIVSEGANTMDIARVSFPTDYPKLRLDAGTNATMGVGIGYAIAAKLAHPEKSVVCIQGDSAFGFSGLELETASRYQLGIVFVVMNNSGIYHGEDSEVRKTPETAPSTALSPQCQYHLVAQGLGCQGFLVRNLADLHKSFKEALKLASQSRPALINVIIEPGRQKKISFGWQKAAKL